MADRIIAGVLAGVWRALGGDCFSELCAPATAECSRDPVRRSRRGLVCRWRRFAGWDGADSKASGLNSQAHRPAWWVGGVAFIGIELIVHLILLARGKPNAFDGRR